MPAFNFKAQFAPLVAEGIKRTTIRQQRKHGDYYQHPVIGQRMVLYRGQRTKGCEMLRDERLVDYHAIQIHANSQILLDNQPLNEISAQRLARLDGFFSVETMINFFKQTYGLPFGVDRPADLLQWSVKTQDNLWYGLDFGTNYPYRCPPLLKTNRDRVMVYEGPFENPQLCDLPYIMCGLPKNWERIKT